MVAAPPLRGDSEPVGPPGRWVRSDAEVSLASLGRRGVPLLRGKGSLRCPLVEGRLNVERSESGHGGRPA